MNNKVTISFIIALIIIILGLGIWIFILNKNYKTDNNYLSDSTESNIINTVNISSKNIIDDCLNEWDDYEKKLNEEVESTSNDMFDENTHYVVKSIDGYIHVYYIDNLNEEILYKKTDISTEYLSIDDLNNLKIGVEVTGSKELNQLLEDFE